IMTMASIAFMIPLSVSSAVAVKVGHALGQKNKKNIELYGKAAISIALVFTLFSATLFYTIPEFLMGIVSKDKSVIALGVQLLFVVAIFQLVDSMQVTLTGILRGLKYTNFSSVMVFI